MKSKLFALVILTLMILSVAVSAGNFQHIVTQSGSQPFVAMDKILINGVEADEFNPVYLERGQDVSIEVYFTGAVFQSCKSGNSNPCYNTKVSTEINGYEYGDVRDSTPNFEVEPGVQYRKVLHLKIPQDMLSSEDLQLQVQVQNEDDFVMVRVPVRVQEIRHKVNVYDVIFNPTNYVQAGQPLFTSIRVENLGDNVESSIKATVAIPALGIQTSEYVDKLTTLQSTNNDPNTNDASTSNDLMLLIPQNAPEGDYDVIVSLEYNRGASTEQKSYKMHIRGTQSPLVQTQNQNTVTINVDNSAQRVETGNGAVYKFSIANLGQQPVQYTFNVVGAADWANTRVEPGTLVVQPNSAGEAYVYVAPKDGMTGLKTFTVKVMSGTALVAEKNLSLEVVNSKSTDLKTVFTWLFIVLLLILAILVIVVLVKKYSSSEGKGIEGQTYY